MTDAEQRLVRNLIAALQWLMVANHGTSEWQAACNAAHMAICRAKEDMVNRRP